MAASNANAFDCFVSPFLKVASISFRRRWSHDVIVLIQVQPDGFQQRRSREPLGAVIQDDGKQREVIDEACAVWTLAFASFFFIALESTIETFSFASGLSADSSSAGTKVSVVVPGDRSEDVAIYVIKKVKRKVFKAMLPCALKPKKLRVVCSSVKNNNIYMASHYR